MISTCWALLSSTSNRPRSCRKISYDVLTRWRLVVVVVVVVETLLCLTRWFAVDSRAWYRRHVLKNGRAENIGRGRFSAHRATQAHFRGQAI